MPTTRKYNYRCVIEPGGNPATKRNFSAPRIAKLEALAISRRKGCDVRVQRQTIGGTIWENTRSLFRRGQQMVTATGGGVRARL